MGKYMRKAKITGEVAVMEVAHQSSLGVRTRARTLALQRLQRSSSPTPAPAPTVETDDGSYLQLRSRRLEKPPMTASRPKDSGKDGTKSGLDAKNASEHATHKPRLTAACFTNSGSAGSVAPEKGCSKKGGREIQEPVSEASPDNDGAEASFGENIPDFEQDDRYARETTPCSLIRDSDSVRTPGSTTRTRTISSRTQISMHRSIPTTDEMEDFFAGAEQFQQRIFTDKYNFDPVNDCPLPGRYEWVKLNA